MRVALHGQGTRIPDVALPDPNVDSNFPPQTFLFTESGEFSKVDWEGLGYTNYEVVCIGGAGGRGSNAVSELSFSTSTLMQSVPQGVWDLVLERAMYEDYFAQSQDYYSIYYNDPHFYEPAYWGGWVHSPYTAPAGIYPPPLLNRLYTGGNTAFHGDYPFTLPYDGTFWRWYHITQQFNLTVAASVDFTYKQAVEWSNPTHKVQFYIVKDLKLGTTVRALGGAGGGGGRHVVSGFLADLPDIVPVIVGNSGADGELGQTIQNGIYTPQLGDSAFTSGGYYLPSHQVINPGDHPYIRRMAEIDNYMVDYTVSFPSPHPSFPNPQPGQDGGASSFGGDIAQASGGKGGRESAGWPGGVLARVGSGGDGGSGGRIIAGGGGIGGVASGQAGQDGTWDGDIGKGGGGGKAGGQVWNNPYVTPPVNLPAVTAGNGGRGSYSFSDTTVYGPRQGKSGIIPGGGGGSVLNSATHYGSKALNALPDGAVFVRVIKVDS